MLKQCLALFAAALVVAGCSGSPEQKPSCSVPSDCPGADTACSVRSCEAGVCGTSNVAAGTALADPTAGDCQQLTCDGQGNQVTANLTPGTACTTNGGKVCSTSGTCEECHVGSDCQTGVCISDACAPATCIDTVKNGSESDVDCGGSCAKCADNKACTTAAECQSGVCTTGSCAVPACEDSVVNGTEACDDGNAVIGDGCAACAVEQGFTCTGSPSTCTTTCGDTFRVGTEGCDDGNVGAGDGCSPTCEVESGYACTSGSPSVCTTVCGDSIVTTNEGCDDGAVVDGDGCSSTCAVEANYTCVGSPSVCAPTCGDGAVIAPETCDDGDTIDGNGCSSTCTTETGFTCVGAPSTCTTTCGDGVPGGTEQCDDANVTAGDGCSDVCATEPGYVCTGTPSVCKRSEIEPNDTCADIAAVTPLSAPVIVSGAISPVGDHDYFAFNLSNYSDVTIETFEGSPGACPNIDTVIELTGPVCGTTPPLAGNDEGPIGSCSQITAATHPGARRLAPGTYYVRVNDYLDDDAIPDYGLSISLTAECGNGVTEGSEECDGSANCTSVCQFVVVCGDGVIGSTETCDDAGAVNGDGCSATCNTELNYVCSGAPSTCTPAEQSCSDGIDNDGDNLVDCADPHCEPGCTMANLCATTDELFVFRGAALPASILDQQTTSSSLFVPVTKVVTKVAARINVTHTWDADLDMSLLTPGATSALDVSSDNGSGSDNYTNTVFDSTCTAPIASGTAPFTGCYSPEAPFTPLNGSSQQGKWQFNVFDDGSGDTGTFDDWHLMLCVSP